MAKLFREHQQFTANMESEMDAGTGSAMLMPGKLCWDAGKARFEINTAEMKSSALAGLDADSMKAIGMDKMVSISRPDKKVSHIIYPGMQSYLEQPISASSSTNLEDYKTVTTELGRENIDGHACVKNKVVVTEKDGTKHEYLVWNAADVQNFPIKIEATEQGHKVAMRFKNVQFVRPATAMFETPADCKKYTDMQTMMQEGMMKKMGGMPRLPPGALPPGLEGPDKVRQ
jgi:hypothetical protein